MHLTPRVNREQSADRVEILELFPRAGEIEILTFSQFSLWLRMAHLCEQQAHLLTVVNRPEGFLPDDDLEVGTQEEKRQSFLRG